MPPVESYQRIDIPNTEESNRQINQKSIDQTRTEARIENGSVRDIFEDSSLAPSTVAVKGGSEEAKATLVGGEIGSMNNALNGELAHQPPAATMDSEISETALIDPQSREPDDLNASVNVHEGKKIDRWQAAEQFIELVSDSELYFSNDDSNGPLSVDGSKERNRNHSDVSVSSTGSAASTSSVNNSMLVDNNINLEDGSDIDSVDNLTVEQAFEFLTEQTEDFYIQPRASVP